jgi:mono/diheme cytochrome c family protein
MWLASLWAAALLAAAPAPGASAECTGCHTARRNHPVSRFGGGLGRWNDSQCFGCHAELNDVAAKHARGEDDVRYYGAPVSEERLNQMAKVPLSYGGAPEKLEAGKVPRLSLEGLAGFLRRPAGISFSEGNRAPRMMAYPTLSARDLKAIGALFKVGPGRVMPASAAKGERVWAERCAACHSGPRPLSGRGAAALTMFTPQWMHAYAAGTATGVRAEERKMPTVPLTLSESADIAAWLKEERARQEKALDEKVAQLRIDDVPAGAVPPGFVTYLWGRFFRDATCVHCHSTSPRAAKAFTADAEGLAEYLKRKPGSELWRRLELRAHEAAASLGAREPGMPMAGAELPREVRDLIGRWAKAGCADPEGAKHCAPGS